MPHTVHEAMKREIRKLNGHNHATRQSVTVGPFRTAQTALRRTAAAYRAQSDVEQLQQAWEDNNAQAEIRYAEQTRVAGLTAQEEESVSDDHVVCTSRDFEAWIDKLDAEVAGAGAEMRQVCKMGLS